MLELVHWAVEEESGFEGWEEFCRQYEVHSLWGNERTYQLLYDDCEDLKERGDC